MTVTDADRKKAVKILRAASEDGLIQPTAPMAQPLVVDRVAAALAAERDAARAPFLALASELKAAAAISPDSDPGDSRTPDSYSWEYALEYAADRIEQVMR